MDKLIIAKNRKGNNSVITCEGFWFLHSALSLMGLYQCIKVYLIPFYAFKDRFRTSFLFQKLKREVTL